MADYSRELKKRLQEAGCRFVRQGKGDFTPSFRNH